MSVIGLVCGALLLLSTNVAQATTYVEIPGLEGVDFCDPLQYSHLVIRGVVKNVQVQPMSLEELGLVPAEDQVARVEVSVSRVTIDVTKVLKGNWQDKEITLVSRDGSRVFEPAKEYIACALLRGPQGREFYLTGRELGLYQRKNGGGWKQSFADDRLHGSAKHQKSKKATISDQELLSRVADGNLQHVARSAEVIARGKIVQERVVEYKAPSGASAKMAEFELQVYESVKGTTPGASLRFVVPHLNLVYVPSWYRCVPEKLEIGEEWLVFLRKGESGLYPFAGKNSLLRVDDDQLIYDMRVKAPYTAKRAIEMVRSEVSHEQK